MNEIEETLKPDFEVQVSGHGLGAVVAMLLTCRLKEKGFTLDGKLVTFGQPKVFLKGPEDGKEKEKEKEKEETDTQENIAGAGRDWYARCLREVPLLRVMIHGDPVAALFSNCEQLGAEALLLPGAAFAYSDGATKDASAVSVRHVKFSLRSG